MMMTVFTMIEINTVGQCGSSGCGGGGGSAWRWLQ